jgi:hypothetical protein
MLLRGQLEEKDGVPVLIAGWRQKRKDTAAKRLASRFANKIRAFILTEATPGHGLLLKSLPQDAFLEVPNFDHMHRYLPALFIRAGGRILSLPVNHHPPPDGLLELQQPPTLHGGHHRRGGYVLAAAALALPRHRDLRGGPGCL